MKKTPNSQVLFEQSSYATQVRRLRAFAQAAIQSFDVDVAAIKFINHGENATFKVTGKNGEKYLLRIHRKGYHTKEAILEELRWLEHLSRKKIRAPQPVRSKVRKHIVEVDAPGIGVRNCDLLRWTEGRFLSKSISESDMFKIGRLIADLQRNRPKSTSHRWYWTSEGLVGDNPKFGSIDHIPSITINEQKKLTSARRKIFSRLKVYEKRFPEKMGLIHADLHFGNLLKTPSGEIAAIDFDDCGYGFLVYDLVIPLVAIEYHLQLHERFHKYADLKKALLCGYTGGAKLTQSDRQALQDLILARKLSMVGWLGTRSDNPKLKKRLNAFVAKTLKFIEDPYL